MTVLVSKYLRKLWIISSGSSFEHIFLVLVLHAEFPPELRIWTRSMEPKEWRCKAERVAWPKSHYPVQMAGVLGFCHLYLEASQRHPSSNALKPGPQHLLVDVEWMVYFFIEHTEIFGDVTFVVVVWYVSEAEVYLYGGCITSWKTSEGKELLFVRPDAVFTGQKPIRWCLTSLHLYV